MPSSGENHRLSGTYGRLKEHLFAALDLGPTERRAYVADLRRVEPKLAAELADLLAEADDAETFLEVPMPVAWLAARHAERADTFLGESCPVDPAPGTLDMVGPYRLLEKLGEGGMGVVYLAEQTEPVNRRVALKVMSSTLSGEAVRQRFLSERQALARLAHPYVARFYEAGATASGHPWFAMEYVDGEPLSHYCDRRSLGVRDRLRLFVAACEGVQHAHQKGLVHRDLKPGNILITEAEGQPVPKIIDFGIAKALGEPLRHGAERTTVVVGTPSYLSPEAIRAPEGDDVDTRSDVYALGLVLYQLLVGAQPFEGDDTLVELFRRITERDSPPPSVFLRRLEAERQAEVASRRHSAPAALARSVAGDLDAIVAKATERRRDRRYASASELGADVERHLADEPIEARALSAAYFVGKLVRRYRAATIAASLLIGLGVVHLIQLDGARRETDRARTQAEGLVTFLLEDLYRELEPLGRRDFLEGVSRATLGYFEELPPALREASALREAETLRNLGRVLIQQDDLEGARQAYEAARELDERVLARQSSAAALGALAIDHRRLGDVYEGQGHARASVRSYERARELHTELLAAAPADPQLRHEVAYDWAELGWARLGLGELEAALAAFRASREIHQTLVAESPADPRWRFRLAVDEKNVAEALSAADELEDSRSAFLRAARLYEALVDERPHDLAARFDLGCAYKGLGTVELTTERFEAARGFLDRALVLHRDLMADDPANYRHRVLVALDEVQLGRLERMTGDPWLARERFERALAALDNRPASHLDLHRALAVILLELDRVEQAGPHVERVIAGRLHLDPRHRDLAALLRLHGLLPEA